MNERTLTEIFRRIIKQETVYLRHYYGKIVDVVDPLRLARVKVEVPELGIDSGAGMWCASRSKTSLTTPKQGDWVEIYFMAGDRNNPVYLGEAFEMENMLPKTYKKKQTSQVIFEDPQNKVHIVFDGDDGIMEIGNTDQQFVARLNDEIKSTSAEDSAFWTWIGVVQSWASAVAIALNSLGFPTPFTGVQPSALTGKITKASNQVKVGKK